MPQWRFMNKMNGKKTIVCFAAGVLLALALLSSAFGCAAAPGKGQVQYYEVPSSAPSTTTVVPRPAPAPSPTAVPGTATQSSGKIDYGQVSVIDRLIVRTGQMLLVVQDIPAVMDQITRLADSYKGYVVSSNSWREGERLHGAITIRVPADDFATVMKSLGALAVEVTSQTTTSQDVTEEYVDLSAKLHNLEATEQQLLRILEKAEKVEDILNVQRELSRVRGEIEQTKGRMQYLERTSATSLIEIRLEQSNLDTKFSADKRFVSEGEKVQFKSQVAGGFTPYSYQWDFGDGGTSTDMAPTHSYKSAGSYTVSLKVTDNRGNSDTETTKNYITVQSGWEAGNTASSAWNGFVTFNHVLANIFIWLGIFSPVWIVIGGIIYWRHRRKKKA